MLGVARGWECSRGRWGGTEAVRESTFLFPLGHGLATHHLQHEVGSKSWPQQEVIKSSKVAGMFRHLTTLPLCFGLAIQAQLSGFESL